MTGTVILVDPPLDRTEFERWRREASGALRHAELAEGAELHNWACFSAEQAAQLAVKGVLHAVGAGPWGPICSSSGASAILDFVDGALEPPPQQGDRPLAA